MEQNILNLKNAKKHKGNKYQTVNKKINFKFKYKFVFEAKNKSEKIKFFNIEYIFKKG